MKIIIEPHPDDAILSMSSILHDVDKVITVEKPMKEANNRTSEGLKKFFPHLEIECLNFWSNHFQWKNRMHFTEIRKHMKDEKEMSFQRYINWYILKENKCGELAKKIDKMIPKGSIVYTTFGIHHPQHILVSHILQVLFGNRSDFELCLALDATYFEKTNHINFMKDHITEMDFILKEFENEIYPEKIKIFSKVYPTETYLLRFNSRSLKLNEKFYGVMK